MPRLIGTRLDSRAAKRARLGVIVALVEGAIEQLVQNHRLAHHLFGCGGVAMVQEVPAAQFDRDSCRWRRRFRPCVARARRWPAARRSREMRRRARCWWPTALRRGRARWGRRRARARAEWRAKARSRRACVGAAVGGEVDLHGQQFAVGIERGAMADARRMALGGGGEIFHAVVDHLDRMAALHGEQRGVSSRASKDSPPCRRRLRRSRFELRAPCRRADRRPRSAICARSTGIGAIPTR